MAGDVAYVQVSSGSSRATLGLYSGMSASELQMLVQSALQQRGGPCSGFLVTPTATTRSSRKKKVQGSVQRIVPLSLACQAPELLSGRVFALIAPLSTSQSALEPKNEAPRLNTGSARLERLVAALEAENHLSSFEKELLLHLCEQQKAKVLTVLHSGQSAIQKKQFLLRMLKPGERTAAGPFEAVQEQKKTKRVELPIYKNQDEATLHAELVSKRVAAFGRRVFSPQVQTQVVLLASGCRDKWMNDAMHRKDGVRFTTTMELLGVVERLLDKHALPEEHGAHLLELVLGENRVLLSALQSYKMDGSLLDLETTVKRLAALGCDPPKPIVSKTGKSPKKSTKQLETRNSPARSAVHAVVATPSAVSVVRSLHAQHMLTSLELDIVQALVAQDDTQALRILRDFEQSDHRDVNALRDALVSIVEEITMELGDEEKAAAAFARGVDDAVRDQNEWRGNNGNDSSVSWQQHVGFLLEQWQTRRLLTPADATTLRRMISQRHNLLESAYEVYEGDGDASELLDTLQRVAKLQRQIEQTQVVPKSNDHSPRQRPQLEDVVRQMQRRGSLQPSDAAGLLLLFRGGNEALQAADEAFQADGDVHELEETLLLVVKHAKFGEEEATDESQAVSRLVAELGKSGRLEKWQIQLLLSLIKSNDVRLLAAVDVYNEDQNAEELVDTLEILVELAAWERHRRAMVHDWIPPLAQSGKLPRGGAERLVHLVKERDDRVVAALVVYLSDGNKEEFVDTLARIACLEAMKRKNVNSPVASQAVSKRDEAEEGHLVLALLKELEDSGVVTYTEREYVETLVCNGDPRMLAALDVLATTHDAEDFGDTARRILAVADKKDGINDTKDAEDAKDAKIGKDAIVDKGANKAIQEAAPSSPSALVVGRIEKQLMHLVSELELSEVQAKVLRTAISERHEDVASATETYLQAKNGISLPAVQESETASDEVGEDAELDTQAQKKNINTNLDEAEDQLKEALHELAKRLAPSEPEQRDHKRDESELKLNEQEQVVEEEREEAPTQEEEDVGQSDEKEEEKLEEEKLEEEKKLWDNEEQFHYLLKKVSASAGSGGLLNEVEKVLKSQIMYFRLKVLTDW
ncbi:hypothetical protein BBO99_00004169 [Phytophthora kernoviae]|uniref:Uncharacterized protein n=2 Tax=Phytophthora kernoviae TaxID=325452 RepID=A0A421FED7_9STRA|nr:hypothetical protein G195_007895 [Phytophthora kernoviae 00238/432]KAG2520708.1 hypothetical protein JM16_006618 [Phytophthora kernoviae]KAG2521860.1 hypothetical protein JM18_006408 [Phytophthora kernoviae]RLN38483.1 hypothetical protein BBI17_004815 [Phytophthora kernoviae]RLN80886.1 hypothetical protein BBO99_00004169 [Phytophthora kernoviae]